MNEKIRELAEQAGFYIDLLDFDRIDPENIKIEKFAELIVQECIKEIEFQSGGGPEQEDGSTYSRDWDQAIECVSAMVRHRFGIKS